jgi:hypothetical protein
MPKSLDRLVFAEKKLEFLFLILLVFISLSVNGQENQHNFIAELSAGSVVPNYLNSPQVGLKLGTTVTYYKSSQTENNTNKYYNYPLLGMQAGLYHLGNPIVYGQEITLMPILGIRLKKGMFQWGIGTSYHTKTHL